MISLASIISYLRSYYLVRSPERNGLLSACYREIMTRNNRAILALLYSNVSSAIYEPFGFG
jgi:hypothetical protein